MCAPQTRPSYPVLLCPLAFCRQCYHCLFIKLQVPWGQHLVLSVIVSREPGVLLELLFSQCLVQLFGDPMDCSPPGSNIHRILKARLLEWVAISFSRGSSWCRDWNCISYIAGRNFFFFLNHWATWEASCAHRVHLINKWHYFSLVKSWRRH